MSTIISRIRYSMGRGPTRPVGYAARLVKRPDPTHLIKTRRTLLKRENLWRPPGKARINSSMACLRRPIWDFKSASRPFHPIWEFYPIWEICFESAHRRKKSTKVVLSTNLLASESLTPQRDNLGKGKRKP